MRADLENCPRLLFHILVPGLPRAQAHTAEGRQMRGANIGPVVRRSFGRVWLAFSRIAPIERTRRSPPASIYARRFSSFASHQPISDHERHASDSPTLRSWTAVQRLLEPHSWLLACFDTKSAGGRPESKTTALVTTCWSAWPVTLGTPENSNRSRNDSFSTVLQAALMNH